MIIQGQYAGQMKPAVFLKNTAQDLDNFLRIIR